MTSQGCRRPRLEGAARARCPALTRVCRRGEDGCGSVPNGRPDGGPEALEAVVLSSTERAVTATTRSRTAAEVGDPSVSQKAEPDSTRADFGANEWLVDELYEQYLKDKNSVDPAWWDFFEGYKPEDGRRRRPGPGAADAARRAAPRRRRPTPGRTAGAARRSPRHRPPPPRARARPPAARPAATAAPRPPSRADADVARSPTAQPATAPVRPGRARATPPRRRRRPRPPTTSQKLRGPAARVVTNMEAAPRGPDRDLGARRPGQAHGRQPHRHQQPPRPRPRRQDLVHAPHRLRARRGAGRDAGDERRATRSLDGKPGVLHARARQPRPRDRPGQARRHAPAARADIKKARDRWTSPSSGPPTRTSSAAPAATSSTVDDFAGHDDLADQPRHHRHRALGAAPDAGPGHDHRRRRDGLPRRVPGRVRGAARPRWASPRCSRSPRPTTTGSSRAPSPATSCASSARKLLGEDGFYDRVFAVAARALRAGPLGARRTVDPDAEATKPARIAELIHAYRSRGHLMADTDPLAYRQRKHPDLDIQNHGLTLWDLDRTFPTGGLHRQAAGHAARGPRPAARLVLPHDRRRVHAPAGPAPAPLAPGAPRVRLRPHARARTSCASCAGSTPPRRSRPSCRPSTSARSGSRSRAASRSSRCSTRSCRRPPSNGLDEVGIGMAHRGRLNVLANIAGKSLRADLQRVRGQPGPRSRSRARAT